MPARNGTSVDPGLENIVVSPSRRRTSNVASRTVRGPASAPLVVDPVACAAPLTSTSGTLLQIVWRFKGCAWRTSAPAHRLARDGSGPTTSRRSVQAAVAGRQRADRVADPQVPGGAAPEPGRSAR